MMEDIMGRHSRGIEVLGLAKELLESAKTANEIRICQAVIFPLEGFTLKQTAEKLGRSVRWVSRNRSAFISAKGLPIKASRGGRNHANMTKEEEKKFLASFTDEAKTGRVVTVTKIHIELEKCLGRHVPRSSVYNLLHRNNWRKISPNKRHNKTDVQVQEAWKKNFQKQ